MARRQPRNSSTILVIAVLVHLLLAAVLAWRLLRPDPAPEAIADARPSQTVRARQAPATEGTPVEAPAEPEGGPDEEPYPLTISTGEIRWFNSAFYEGGILQPETFWPSPDEAPLPDTEASLLLQELLDSEVGTVNWQRRQDDDWIDLQERFLDASAAEEYADPVEDPWAALIALEAERRDIQADYAERAVRWRDRYYAALERGEEPPPRPPLELKSLAEPAEAIITHHAADPVADFARLYLLQTRQSISSESYDADAALDLVLESLATTDDPLVNATALSTMLVVPALNFDLDPARRSALTDAYRTQTDPRVRLLLARLITDETFARSAWSEAGDALDEYETACAEFCYANPGHHYCRAYPQVLRMARGQASVGLGDHPDTWLGGLHRAAWHCHTTTPCDTPGCGEGLQPGGFHLGAEARWVEDRWVWSDWQPSTAEFTECMERETVVVVAPSFERPLAVRFTRWVRTPRTE